MNSLKSIKENYENREINLWSSTDDEKIIKDIIGGDGNKFDLLYNKYSKKIYNIVYRLTMDEFLAEDIMQEVFIKVYRNLNKFKFKSSFYTWLYRIAINSSITGIKKLKKNQEKILFDDMPMEDIDPYTKIEKKILNEKIRITINKLSKKQKFVFTLRFYENLPFADISEILKITESSAKTNYHYALKKIKKELNTFL